MQLVLVYVEINSGSKKIMGATHCFSALTNWLSQLISYLSGSGRIFESLYHHAISVHNSLMLVNICLK